MYQRKNFIKVILLSLITCGIYNIVFMYEYDKEVRNLYRHANYRPMEFLLAFLLSLFTCGLFLYGWYYTLYRCQSEEAKAIGVILNIENPIIMTVCMIVPFFCTYLLCDNYNKLLEELQRRGEA